MSQTTETIAVPAPSQPVVKRAAIVGTAPSWKLAPWANTAVDIFGLNDGYVLGMRAGHPQGLPRMSGWYDLHPFAQMSFQPKHKTTVSAFDVPAGAYLRPEGHLQWLKAQTFPVYVNEVPAGWPAHVQAFPRAEIQAQFGPYFASTPAWMLAHLMLQGYTSIEIYGIHLATEWEYIAQRPNFEYLMGVAMARGVTIILPDKCPLLKSKHVYAYEPKPDLGLQAMSLQVAKVKQEGAAIQQELVKTPWLARGRKADLVSRLQVLELELADAKQAQRRLHAVMA